MGPKKGFTRNRVFGLIGVLWGGAVLLVRLAGGGQHTAVNGAYASGQSAGLIFAGLLFLVGLYYLVKG
jgi:hypothetical protein